jgi:uncharacterized lipoprotein YmbA
MKPRSLLLGLTALLSGCIIFDKKSEAVTFHQLASPAAAATLAGPSLFIPRAIIPSALRRPNVVLIDDTGWVRIEDAHRWISPLDRAVSETVGRHLTSLTKLPASTQTPAEDHRSAEGLHSASVFDSRVRREAAILNQGVGIKQVRAATVLSATVLEHAISNRRGALTNVQAAANAPGAVRPYLRAARAAANRESGDDRARSLAGVADDERGIDG